MRGGKREGAGRKPSIGATRVLRVRMTEQQWAELAACCSMADMAMSEYVREAINLANEHIRAAREPKRCAWCGSTTGFSASTTAIRCDGTGRCG